MAHAITALLSHYDEAYQRKFHVRYPLSRTRDPALAKRLLGLYSLEQLDTWIDPFFTLKDDWIERSDYSFGAFSASIARVIAATAKQQSREHGIAALKRLKQM